jgi:hypothetical protein
MGPLPLPSSATAYVDITIILTGSIDIPEWALHEGATNDVVKCPVYAFLVEHKALGKKAFFDLGIHNVAPS